MRRLATRARPAIGLAASLMVLVGCHQPADQEPSLEPLPPLSGTGGFAGARVNGQVGTPGATPPPQISVAPAQTPQVSTPATSSGGGSMMLDFADTDLREVVAQILGTMLHVNYTIDPAVHGTVTLRTVRPISRDQLLATLQTILAQNGATITESGGLYRVLPSASVASNPALAGGAALAGSAVVPLRFASAEDLAKVLQPFAGPGGKIIANPGANSLIITGNPDTREALINMVQAFDVDELAGQSYALLPVSSGDAQDFATALQSAFRSDHAAALAGVVRVIPMQRIDSVLVVAPEPRMIDDVRRVYGLVERARRETVRSWHVYYLQNSRANDTAYVLQEAFTPNNVTAQPSQSGAAAAAQGAAALGGTGSQIGGVAGLGSSGGMTGGTTLGSGTTGGLGSQNGTAGGLGSAGGLGTAGGLGSAYAGARPGGEAAAAANPLLGGLGGGGENGGQANPEAMRIIPDQQNNAILIYATPQEEDTVLAMLRKIDILPLQVRIDAIIAEVDLNDALQYGTQFYFQAGGINGALSYNAGFAQGRQFSNGFPGFVLTGREGGSFAINALQNITHVRVLSSPELMVVDNEPAKLQVGNLVPYLTQTQQSTLTSNAPLVNSVDYRETGVIMQVTPRVNSSGLVTLDIAQEVSSVDTSAPQTTGLNSPTFLERAVQSRVVVQDGQTVGLAGLISDTTSHGNQGIPFLKDIPLLGLLAGSQNNTRQRTELLVLLTPHVVHDQRDARALTEDLRDELHNAAEVPQQLNSLPPSGSSNPQGQLLRRLQ